MQLQATPVQLALNLIAEPLRQLSDNPQELFWQYQWQTHDGGDVFLLRQSI